jgi:hypothetical protein
VSRTRWTGLPCGRPLFNSTPCVRVRCRVPARAMKAVVALAWLAVLLASASFAASDDAGATSDTAVTKPWRYLLYNLLCRSSFSHRPPSPINCIYILYMYTTRIHINPSIPKPRPNNTFAIYLARSVQAALRNQYSAISSLLPCQTKHMHGSLFLAL